MNTTQQRKIAIGTLALIGATTFASLTAKPASANSKTWKNIAIGAGVVTGYGLLKGQDDLALIGGLATAGSYLKYRDEKKDEERDAWRNDWRHHRYDYWRR
jgi:hypothetical protein